MYKLCVADGVGIHINNEDKRSKKMINKAGKNIDKLTIYEVSCDKCSDGTEYEAEDWDHLIEQMKEDGWKNFKHGDKWQNACPDCAL